MAANSRPIVLDLNGKPAPQYYNPTTDAYEYLQGEAGAARSILYGPDGQALSVVNRKLEVRATELEERLGATTDAAQTNPALAASQIALLKGLLSQLQGGGSGAAPADVIDRAARILGKVSADDGAIAALGALADAVQTDPAQAASVIALLKGLLQTLRTDSAKVQLTGRYDYQQMSVGQAVAVTNRVALFMVEPYSYPVSAVIHFEGSADGGTTWVPLWVRPIYGDIPQQYVIVPNWFVADVQHLTHVRWVEDDRVNYGFKVSVKFVPHIEPQVVARVTNRKRYAPVPARLSPTIRDAGGREVDWVTPDGTVYAYAGYNLYKSTNFGQTWTNISKPWSQGSVRRVRKLSTGELVVVGNNLDGTGGLQVWRSDANETNWQKVATLATVSDAGAAWGMEVYPSRDGSSGDIILFAPYKAQPRQATDTLEAYLSRDGGLTWSVIYTAPAVNNWQFHGIKLDPYEGRIWLLNGDGASLTNVRFSDDWGATWQTLWPDGQAPVQFTDLVALPDCILFGLDDNIGRGFLRLDKPYPRATAGDLRLHLHEAFFVDAAGANAQATGRMFIGPDGAAYLPYETPRGMLTATKDGRDFYVLWDYTQQPSGGPEGLMFMGATDSGKLVAQFRDNNVRYIWVADAPQWVEI